LSEEWQFCFFVKGLVAPEKEVIFDDILIKGMPPSDDASVFFKVSTRNEEEKDDLRDNLRNDLRNIILVYDLVANRHVEVLSGSSYRKIDSEHAFGDKRLCMHLRLIPVFNEEERKKNIPTLEKAITKYKEIKDVFQQKKERFLKNAIDYYSRSLGDNLLEEKLIDLMIALESLFSKETQELRLRISQRASFFLGGNESELPKIFRDIYSLYDKRSKVVHGTEDVKLEWIEIENLKDYVRESIKRFIHIGMSKDETLDLLDGAVYDSGKKKLLSELVEKAIEKW